MNSKLNTNKLFITLTILVFFLLIFIIIFDYILQKQSIEKNTINRATSYEDYFEKSLIKDVNDIHDSADFIRINETYTNLFLLNEKEKLYKSIKPAFDELNKKLDITHLYFIEKDGRVFLRVHDYERDNDIINRYTFKKSKETNHIVYGLELGVKNTFTLRLVHHWYKNNELVGYIEIGKEIDKVMADIASRMNLNTILALKKDVYKNPSKKFLNRLKEVKKTEKYYVTYSTVSNINQDLLDFIESNQNNLSIKLNGEYYVAYKYILTDVTNKDLGFKILLIDVTKDYETLYSQFKFYLSIMVLGTILMLFIGYKFSKYYQNKLNLSFNNLKEEKQKVENLSKEQKTLLELFDIGDPVLFKWNNDVKWSVDYVSNNISNLLGYTKEEFLSNKINYSDCIFKEDLEKVLKEVNNAISSKECKDIKHLAYRVVDKFNNIKWVMDYTVIIRNSKGNITHFLGYIIDISEMKYLENILEEEKLLLKTILDSSNAIIATIDKKGVMTNINKYGAELVGYTQEEIASKPYFWFEKFLLSNDKPSIKTIIEALEKQGPIVSTRTNPWIDKNGEQRPIEWSNSLLYGANNKVEGLITVGIDVTEKHKKELELIEEKNKFQQLVNNATDGVHILDIDGNILDCSYSFAQMLKYTKEEVLKLNVRDWDGKFNENEIIEKLDEYIKYPATFETKHIRKDGSSYIAQVKAQGIVINNKNYLYASVRDITIEKNAYKKLEKFIDLQDNIIILTNGFKINFANKNFLKFTNFLNLEAFKEKYDDISDLFIENENFFSLEKEDKDFNWIKKIEKLPDNKRVIAILSKNYNVHAFSVNINFFENDLYIVTLTDISQTMIEKVNLRKKTLHDKLTNAYNREYFEENCSDIIDSVYKENLKLGIAFIDIDFFKKVNDTFGHSVGDDVLIEFVDRIKKKSRGDDKLIRWGGEEFIFIFKLKNEEDLSNILENLRMVIEEKEFTKTGKITCSIGATIHINNENINNTINRADEAVYKAKENGRNQVVMI